MNWYMKYFIESTIKPVLKGHTWDKEKVVF